jgi:ribonuclease Z
MLHTHSFGAERNASSSQPKDSVIILDDEVVRISAMFVKPKYHNGAGSLNDVDSKPGDTAIVYACELPKYRELQLGNSVQSDQFDEMVSSL